MSKLALRNRAKKYFESVVKLTFELGMNKSQIARYHEFNVDTITKILDVAQEICEAHKEGVSLQELKQDYPLPDGDIEKVLKHIDC